MTGVLSLEESKRILKVGWNRKIVTYDDSHPEETKVKPCPLWKGGQVSERGVAVSAFVLVLVLVLVLWRRTAAHSVGRRGHRGVSDRSINWFQNKTKNEKNVI